MFMSHPRVVFKALPRRSGAHARALPPYSSASSSSSRSIITMGAHEASTARPGAPCGGSMGRAHRSTSLSDHRGVGVGGRGCTCMQELPCVHAARDPADLRGVLVRVHVVEHSCAKRVI